MISQARIHHNPLAPEILVNGDDILHKTAEFALLWQCAVCTSWTRDPVRYGYSIRCNICKLARPPRVVIYDEPDVEKFRLHAAHVAAFAAELRQRRYRMISAATIHNKRQGCISPMELFLQLADLRDAEELAATSKVGARPTTWLTQAFSHGERYVGETDGDYCNFHVWPGLLDDSAEIDSSPTTEINPAASTFHPGNIDNGDAGNVKPTQRGRRPSSNVSTELKPHPATAEFQQLELRSSLEATYLCRVRLIQSRAGQLNVVLTVAQELEGAWFRYLELVLGSLDRLPFRIEFDQKYVMLAGKLVTMWLLGIDTESPVELHFAVLQVRQAFMRVVNAAVDLPKAESLEWVRELKLDEPAAKPTVAGQAREEQF